MTSLDSFKCRKILKVGSKSYVYYSLVAAEKNGLRGISRLPFSLKVLLENMLRHEDARTVTKDDIQGFAHWLKNKTSEREVPFRPARVLMQGLHRRSRRRRSRRHARRQMNLGGDPKNQSARSGRPRHRSFRAGGLLGNNAAFKKNVEEEYKQNQERYRFLKWAQRSFENFRVVPPGTGICHQVNLEYLSRTVWTNKATVEIDGKKQQAEVAYPTRWSAPTRTPPWSTA